MAAGDGSTMIAALKNHKILCGMTTQPTVAAIEKLGVGYPAFDLTTTAGVKKWLGGFTPTAGVLALSSWVDSHKDTVQKVVDALVATMHWLSTHSAADVANVLPPSFVNNSLVTKPVYISTLATDKTQFLPDGKRFLFSSTLGAPETRGVFIGSLEKTPPRRVNNDESAGRFAPPDKLMSTSQGALRVYNFDPESGVTSGEPVGTIFAVTSSLVRPGGRSFGSRSVAISTKV